jgi:excisionase family DNA binding protein
LTSVIKSKSIMKRLYTVEEVACYLGRTVNAIREMQWAGKLSYIRGGKRILFDIRDMDQWIESRRQTETS